MYSSSWIKLHYPAEFACAARAQPMGFYSPHSIVRDAMHHGVEVLGPDRTPAQDCTLAAAPPAPDRSVTADWHADPSTRAVRMGCATSAALPTRCSTASTPNVSARCSRRSPTSPAAPARHRRHRGAGHRGAFGTLGETRRSALWAAGALRDARADKLPGLVTGVAAPPLPV